MTLSAPVLRLHHTSVVRTGFVVQQSYSFSFLFCSLVFLFFPDLLSLAWVLTFFPASFHSFFICFSPSFSCLFFHFCSPYSSLSFIIFFIFLIFSSLISSLQSRSSCSEWFAITLFFFFTLLVFLCLLLSSLSYFLSPSFYFFLSSFPGLYFPVHILRPYSSLFLFIFSPLLLFFPFLFFLFLFFFPFFWSFWFFLFWMICDYSFLVYPHFSPSHPSLLSLLSFLFLFLFLCVSPIPILYFLSFVIHILSSYSSPSTILFIFVLSLLPFFSSVSFFLFRMTCNDFFFYPHSSPCSSMSRHTRFTHILLPASLQSCVAVHVQETKKKKERKNTTAAWTRNATN